MSSSAASASPAHGHAASHGDHHEPSFLNKVVFGPYRFERIALEFPFRLGWAFLGFLWGIVRHPIKTVKSIPLTKILVAWGVLYVAVMVFSTVRGDKNVLGTIWGPFVYAGHGLMYLVADSWRTMDFFIGVLAHDLGAVTGLHGIVLLAFAMLFPHATIAIGIVAACETIAWWCDYGTVAGAIGTIIGTIGVLAAMAKFVPGMSLGSGGGHGGGGGGHGGH